MRPISVRHEVLFREDLRNILLAIDESNWNVARYVPTPHMKIYRRGFTDALAAVARALDIPLQLNVDGDGDEANCVLSCGIVSHDDGA